MKQYQINNFKYIKKLKEKPTKTELVVKEWLETKKVRFIFQKGFLLPFHRIVDFYIPKKKIIIEIDGGYHTNFNEMKKDNNKDIEFLSKRNMNTIRITNKQVETGEYKQILSFLV